MELLSVHPIDQDDDMRGKELYQFDRVSPGYVAMLRKFFHLRK